ncbi:MAG: GntR family transcriptional regulator [Bacteroidaceae bacterium]|nr:GntR family transcriptional regulator [Bacteroidaceae bacterium]
MIKLGDWNELVVNRFTDHGAYLEGGEVGEILMPNAYVERGVRIGDRVTVFVYLDQEERLVATTETPLARVGQFACLTVSWVNEFGAFLDWGLMKDLFVPFREQRRKMEVGRYYIVYIYIDEASHRIVGTAKVDRYLMPAPAGAYRKGEQVALLVQGRTDLGYKVIVDHKYSGLVYHNQAYAELHTGDELTGFVSQVRRDGKVDVSLQSLGVSRFRDFADQLLDELEQAGGTLPYCDASSAEDIAERFGVSKKTFKRAVGTLYKASRIHMTDGGIALGGQPKAPRPVVQKRTPRPRFKREKPIEKQ